MDLPLPISPDSTTRYCSWTLSLFKSIDRCQVVVVVVVVVAAAAVGFADKEESRSEEPVSVSYAPTTAVGCMMAEYRTDDYANAWCTEVKDAQVLIRKLPF